VIIPAKYGIKSVIFISFIRCKYIPKQSIDGTHRPINRLIFMAIKNKISEYTNEARGGYK
jgi:hypothetical protein